MIGNAEPQHTLFCFNVCKDNVALEIGLWRFCPIVNSFPIMYVRTLLGGQGHLQPHGRGDYSLPRAQVLKLL